MEKLGYVEHVGNAYRMTDKGQHSGPEAKAPKADRYDPGDS